MVVMNDRLLSSAMSLSPSTLKISCRLSLSNQAHIFSFPGAETLKVKADGVGFFVLWRFMDTSLPPEKSIHKECSKLSSIHLADVAEETGLAQFLSKPCL